MTVDQLRAISPLDVSSMPAMYTRNPEPKIIASR